MRKTTWALAAALLITAFGIVFVTSAMRNDDKPDNAALTTLVQRQQWLHTHTSGHLTPWAPTLADSLPNVDYDGAMQGQSFTTSAVRGHVTDIEPVRGIDHALGLDTPVTDTNDQTVPYNSPKAEYREVKITVAVDDVLAGDAITEFSFPYTFPGPANTFEQPIDAATVEAGWRQVGEALWLPNDNWRTVGDYQVATVTDDDSLNFVFLTDSVAFEHGLDHATEVRTQGRKATTRRSAP